jgi:hypothetical protein
MESGEINIGNVLLIHEKVDPGKSLPKVELKYIEELTFVKGTYKIDKYNLDNGDQEVGKMSIITDAKNHISWINEVEVNDEYKGKGFGLAAHVIAIERSLKEGNNFRTHDWSHSEGSKKIWEVLEKKGVAKVIEPFKPDGNGKYIGHYEIKK